MSYQMKPLATGIFVVRGECRQRHLPCMLAQKRWWHGTQQCIWFGDGTSFSRKWKSTWAKMGLFIYTCTLIVVWLEISMATRTCFFLMIFLQSVQPASGKGFCHGRVMPTMFSRQGFRCVPNLWKTQPKYETHRCNVVGFQQDSILTFTTLFRWPIWNYLDAFSLAQSKTHLSFKIFLFQASAVPPRFDVDATRKKHDKPIAPELETTFPVFFFGAKLSGAKFMASFPRRTIFEATNPNSKKNTSQQKQRHVSFFHLKAPQKCPFFFLKISLAIYAITANKPTTKVSRSKYQFVKSHVVGPGCWIGSRSWKMGSGRSWGYLWFAMDFLEWHGNFLC